MERLNLVIDQYGRWADLRAYTERIEASVHSDFSQALENAKSLLETICKEICAIKEIEIETTASFNKVINKAYSAMGYPPSTPVTSLWGM